jgi:hypothetical protein
LLMMRLLKHVPVLFCLPGSSCSSCLVAMSSSVVAGGYAVFWKIAP